MESQDTIINTPLILIKIHFHQSIKMTFTQNTKRIMAIKKIGTYKNISMSMAPTTNMLIICQCKGIKPSKSKNIKRIMLVLTHKKQ